MQKYKIPFAYPHMPKILIFLFAVLFTFSASNAQQPQLAVAGEKHLANIKQLTFGGENAEAYFSFDGKQLIFQSKRDGRGVTRSIG